MKDLDLELFFIGNFNEILIFFIYHRFSTLQIRRVKKLKLNTKHKSKKGLRVQVMLPYFWANQAPNSFCTFLNLASASVSPKTISSASS